VWDVESGRALRTLRGYTSDVKNVAVTPDGRRAVSASTDKTLKAWDLETGLTVAAFVCDAAVRCCAFANQQTIIACDGGGRVHFLVLEEKGGA
jgi:WD40 repeat protein